jgi:hypothetical protein
MKLFNIFIALATVFSTFKPMGEEVTDLTDIDGLKNSSTNFRTVEPFEL